MDANQLLELVKRYQDSKSFITNEETAKLALVVPFICGRSRRWWPGAWSCPSR
ncbi:hypothetical protein [Corallococcus sp. CA053C]|uniref:hypothetical protein n=1 Tax=Corallococcus sp. CA053C TaxID=2316732 RepID=UPI0013152797|nr:hypothetical protein [Corallococcus sp. CA053C]